MRFRVRNGTYRAILADTEDAITEQVASRDLRQLTSANLLIAHGAARGRYYVATKELADLRAKIVAERDPRDDSDPFQGA
jgi:hypothetical protein